MKNYYFAQRVNPQAPDKFWTNCDVLKKYESDGQHQPIKYLDLHNEDNICDLLNEVDGKLTHITRRKFLDDTEVVVYFTIE
jgi:hypothetical protein